MEGTLYSNSGGMFTVTVVIISLISTTVIQCLTIKRTQEIAAFSSFWEAEKDND